MKERGREGERGRLSILRKKQFGFLKNLGLKRRKFVTGEKSNNDKEMVVRIERLTD